MPFEFYNPHTCRQGCHLGPQFGEVKVEPGQYVPTPEQEASGITAAMFEPHVNPSFLHKTPGNIRRRLRLEQQEKEKAARVEENARLAAESAVAAVGGATGVVAAPQASTALVEASGEPGGDGTFGGEAPATPPAPAAPVAPVPTREALGVPPTGGPRRPEDSLGGNLQKTGNDLQRLADGKCSSTKKEGKKLR